MIERAVDLELSEEQHAIADLFAAIAEGGSSSAGVREPEALGFSPTLWRLLSDAGAPGMALGEDVGGGGAGLLELALVVEALGRRVAPAPLVEHTVAARLLADLGALPRDVVDGTAVATLALRPLLDGTARLVPAGAVAAVVVALHGDDLVLVEGSPPGAAVPNLASAPLADRPVTDARVVASGRGARDRYEQALGEWRALTASALVGVGLGALDLGVAYTIERKQFGKPIGSFQAIQHTLADVAVALDGAQLLARKAAWAFDGARVEAPELAAMALLFAAEHSQRATERVLHFHGGYGFMQEYDIQLYYRRAKGWPLVLDSPARECERLAARRYGAA
jgi:alkylation response protein AidB-like acyl-CoA dehydrogenase